MPAKNKAGIVLLGIFLFSYAYLFGQSDDADQNRIEDNKKIAVEKTQELIATEKLRPTKKMFVFDWGGVFYEYFRDYKNTDNDKGSEDWVNTVTNLDLFLWLKTVYDNYLTFYCRTLNSYTWRGGVSSDYTGDGQDYDGPKFDMIYLNFDFAQKPITFPLPLSLKIGRQYFSMGKGIVYSATHDGIQIDYYPKPSLNLRLLVSKTLRHEDNIDYSVPGYQKGSERYFSGLELSWIKERFSLYGYALLQRDFSEERPEDDNQDYKYNSEYLGGGLYVTLSPNSSGWLEIIKEYGESYTDANRTTLQKSDIDAWAFNSGLRYKINSLFKPTLEIETAYGSGDSDRTRVTNTNGGNVAGDDENFLYFGIFLGGYALSPRLSNLYIHKISLSLNPFEKISSLQDNLGVGVKFFIYQKDKKEGRIYDIEASETNKDVGSEVDFFVHWRINESLYFTGRYGIFFPEAAYPESTRDQTKYLYLRLKKIF